VISSVYVQRLGDDALIAAQQMGEWITRAPQIEEDVAMANITLDLLGQARVLLAYAGELEGAGRDEEDLAFLRDEREFTNVQLVELPNGDFAVSMAKLLFFSCYQYLLYDALTHSQDERLAALATKAVKECAYHVDYASGWVRRLGDGTEESHRRMRQGVERIWPYTRALFASDPVCEAVDSSGDGVDPSRLRGEWLERVEGMLHEAGLTVPEDDWAPAGGREGLHTETFGPVLAQMQALHRAHPGARW
jgi:ring-1,2-phenylacetyl-CoA epoxidase subunit PaaC